MLGLPGQDYRKKRYEDVSKDEKLRSKNFKVVKEYENFYLCEKYGAFGEFLYRECFGKFDIDGVPKYSLRGQAIFGRKRRSKR